MVHTVPSGAVRSGGQVAEVPVQVSAGSHTPLDDRQTVVLLESWQPVQQSSLDGSHTAPCLNLHVVGSQHELLPQPWEPPQSQSSPGSTMPLPHWLPVMVVTSLLLVKQLLWTLWRPRAEQMLPMLHAENCVMPVPVEGFMRKRPFASHELELSGQHCCLVDVPSAHDEDVQSCTGMVDALYG